MKLYEEEREKAACSMLILLCITHYCLMRQDISTKTSNNRWFANRQTFKTRYVPIWWFAYGKIRYRRIRLQNGSKTETSSKSIAKLTMMAYLMYILQKCVLHRTAHIVTGLPDAYSRGRIIGDYRRIALYGVDYLIEDKKNNLASLMGDMLEDVIRDREEIQDQIRSLKELKEMAASHGYDISEPAKDVQESYAMDLLRLSWRH